MNVDPVIVARLYDNAVEECKRKVARAEEQVVNAKKGVEKQEEMLARIEDEGRKFLALSILLETIKGADDRNAIHREMDGIIGNRKNRKIHYKISEDEIERILDNVN